MPAFPLSFDPDFAGPGDWAAMYRELGLQVVPAKTFQEDRLQWKRPALPKWRALEHEIVPDLTFTRWYGYDGEHCRRNNMGIITGSCSSGVFVLDLDMHKNPKAREWWQGVLTLHNFGGDIETPTQTTGGGGKQLLFRAPAGWVPPTCKTSIGVDIRGQGGFAMLPSSVHESGREYVWDDGREPWEVEVVTAPKWLCDEIDQLSDDHGGSRSAQPSQRTEAPEAVTDAFGFRVDDREDHMYRLVWGRVVDLWREAPMKPSPAELDAQMRDAFMVYERGVKSRIVEPGTPNHVLLDREGRGPAAFAEKWRAAIKQWDGKVAEHGAQRPREAEAPADGVKFDPETGEILDEQPAPKQRIELIPWDHLPDIKVRWLIKDFLPAGGFGALYGKPGSYKSFVALYLSACVACGKPAFDRETTAGDVVYIAGEGGAGLKKRRDAFMREYDLPPGTKVHFIRAQLNLRSTPEDVDAVVSAIRALGLNPVLIIIDTLARAFAGGNENASEDMGAFISQTSRLQEALGGPTILVVHHSGKDEAKGMRGHSALLGAVDTELEVVKLSADDSPDRIGQMTVTKQKDGEDGFSLTYRLKLVTLSDIDPSNSSLVVVPTEDRPKPRRRMSAAQAAVFKALQEAIGEAGAFNSLPSTSGNKVVHIPIWRDYFYRSTVLEGDTRKRAFARASKDLAEAGHVKVFSELVWISDA